MKPKGLESYTEKEPTKKEIDKKRQKQMQETMKLRQAKASVVRQTVTVKSIKKNKEKYDVKKILREA